MMYWCNNCMTPFECVEDLADYPCCSEECGKEFLVKKRIRPERITWPGKNPPKQPEALPKDKPVKKGKTPETEIVGTA